eukprot:scaffold7821_cov103-Skeletonema_marinoi.AAC.3
MSNGSLKSFHLACLQDGTETEESDGFSSANSSTAVSIRNASALHIYRCQGQVCCCNNIESQAAQLLAILVPHSLTRSIKKIADDHKENNNIESIQRLRDAEVELRKSIHPCLVQGEGDATISQLTVREVITSTNLPADIIILAPNCDNSNRHDDIIFHYCNLLNHDTVSNAPWSVIKAFPISILSNNTDSVGIQTAAIPCCPVCLNRIDPSKLGLPNLKPQHSCSRWCSSNTDGDDAINGQLHSCRNEILFIPWAPPSHCVTCQIISQKDYFVDNALQQSSLTGSPLSLSSRPAAAVSSTLQMKGSEDTIDSLMCHDCGMTSTLWVCLTCGYVGCGRYTRKHAAQHYSDERHPYSLELATGRIWDYDSGTFAHRKDLMECPVLSMTWGNADSPIRRQGSDYSSSSLVASSLTGRMDSYQGNSSLSQAENHVRWKEEEAAGEYKYDSNDEAAVSCIRQHSSPLASKSSTPPKKSIMISLEYEALLQSALEDQSQHFEGEISRLRADFAASRLQDTQISDTESREIDALRKDCDRLNSEVEKLSSTLLDLQTDEAKHRATSQKLLRDQTISKDLLEKIRMDTTKELESSDEMFEDLQLQISDLTANIRMMQQIAVDDELNQAQIFGTTGGVKETKQRGKKSRRSNRKR